MLPVLLCAALSLTGCYTSSPVPIHTSVEITSEPLGVSYDSEKDVLYKRTLTDPDSGVVEQVEFRAVASAPALAQVERETITSQAQLEQARALNTSLQVLSQNAASVLGADPPPPPAAE